MTDHITQEWLDDHLRTCQGLARGLIYGLLSWYIIFMITITIMAKKGLL